MSGLKGSLLDQAPAHRSTEEQTEAVLARIASSQDFREQQIERVVQWRKMYRQRRLYSRAGANYPQPLAFEIVEDIVAQFYAATIGEPALLTDNRFQIENVEALQDWWHTQLHDSGYAQTWTSVLREIAISSLGCTLYGIREKTISGKKQYCTFFQSLKREEYWIDPQEKDLKDPAWFAWLFFLRRSEIRKRIQSGAYQKDAYEEAEQLILTARRTGQRDYHSAKRAIYGTDDLINLANRLSLPDPFDTSDPVDPLIPIIGYFGDVPGSDSLLENQIAFYAWGARLLSLQDNPFPFKPISFFRWIPSESGSEGISICEALEPSYTARCETQNMIFDIMDMATGPMYVAGQRAELSQSRIQHEPFKVIRLGGSREEFDVLKTPDLPSWVFAQLEILRQNGQGAVGRNDILAGLARPPRKTARESDRLASSVGVRFQLYVQNLESDLSLMHQRALQMWSHYLTKTQLKQQLIATQGDRAELTDKALRQDLATFAQHVRVNSDAERADVQGNRQRWLFFLDRALQNPRIQPIIRMRRAVQKFAEAAGINPQDPIIIQPNEYGRMAKASTAPEEEHRRIVDGLEIEVLEGDDHLRHIESHLTFIAANPQTSGALLSHAAIHMQSLVESATNENRELRQAMMQELQGMGLPVQGAASRQGGS